MSVSPSYRVVHAIPHLRGTPGCHVVDLALEQHRRMPGSVAVVLSLDAEEPWTTSSALVEACRGAGVPVFWCGEFFRRDVTLLNDAARVLRAQVLAGQPWPSDAVVHAHTAMAAAVGRKAGAPRVVATLHGVGRGRPREFDLQDDLALMACDAVLVPSERMAERLRTSRGYTHVVVVPPFVGAEGTRATAASRNGRRVVCAGPLNAESGTTTVLEAMPVVWARIPDAQLHIIGQGELDEPLRARARDLDPTGQRVIVDTTEGDVAARLGMFDVFASASRAERPDQDALEALAAGLPVVALRDSGLAEVVGLARCGLVVPHDTPREFGLAMAVLLETGERNRHELGTPGRQYGTERLGVDAHLSALEGIYGPPAPARARHSMTGEGPVRLHLGSGGERRPGWLNVDARAEAMPDLVARVDALPMVPDASVDEIEACHLFEHLPLHEAHKALREWARVLRPGGRLFLELPNFEACVRILGQAADPVGYDFGMIGIFGWPPAVEQDGDAMAHRWGWTPDTLTTALEAAGFTQVQRLPITQTYRPAARYDRDFRIGATRAGLPAEQG